MRVLRPIACLLVGAALVVGCGAHTMLTPTTSLARQCGTIPTDASRVTLRGADGLALGAAVVGPSRASLGIVLAYGVKQTLCDWLGEAARLAGTEHARVLVIDQRGTGSTPGRPSSTEWAEDVRVGIRRLVRGGSTRVALLGSQMGAAIVLVAASPTGLRTGAFPPSRSNTPLAARPCAVVGISALGDAEDYGSLSALALGSFDTPVSLAYSRDDHNANVYVPLFTRLFARTGVALEKVSVDGADEGLDLIEHHGQVRALIARALARCRATR